MHLLLLLLIITTFSSFLHQTYSICVDFYDPTNLRNSSIVDCPPRKIDNVSNENLELDDNLFQVNFDCQINDQDLCNKVAKTFEKAGNIITYALIINTPIIVEATFSEMDSEVLGGATPTRFITILDEDDQVERLYPQALVKQLNLVTKPAGYAESDITAKFNSLKNWYFYDDNKPIKNDQYDLLNTVLHEFIHGLGFVTGWRNYVEEILETETSGLTPFILTDKSDPPSIPKTPFKFLGFYETIFDKFIITKDNNKQIRFSTFANDLNKFIGINNNFTGISDFSAVLQNSPQYNSAKQVLSSSTKKNSLIFMPKGGKNIPDDGIVLESSVNPFKAGTSIGHVDFNIYDVGDSDFLMRRANGVGKSMNSLILKSGNRTGSAIGPRLLNVLSSIGYNLANNPIKPKSKTSDSIRPIIIDYTLIFQITLCVIINHFL